MHQRKYAVHQQWNVVLLQAEIQYLMDQKQDILIYTHTKDEIVTKTNIEVRSQTLTRTSSMYRLPAGSGGTEALSIKDPTPTFLSVELSYIETRHVTGVVPSGNSSGNSAISMKTKYIIILYNQYFTFRSIIQEKIAIHYLRLHGSNQYTALEWGMRMTSPKK